MASAQTAVLDESAAARLPGEHFVPAAGGGPLQLEVPVPGFVDDVRKTFKRFAARHSKTGVNPDVRPRVYGLQPYRVAGLPDAKWAGFCLEALDRRGYFVVPWRKAREVASWLRHAAAEALTEEGYSAADVNRSVLGHPEDTRDRGRHLSFAPLPSIGHPHSDAGIRRALIIEPSDSAGELAELLQLKLAGHILTDAKARPVCMLTEADNQSRMWSLYCGASRLWRSVTPVVLHGHTTSHGKLSLTKLERLLIEAFERGGYSGGAIETISVQQAPFWSGTEGALRISVPAHLARWPRYHVQVRFRAPVDGPVLAGIGRHFGIGVFATAPAESD
jgi:CRISPR-associated protein Csb2